MIDLTATSSRPLNRRSRSGFTLVELIVVGALIALFSSLAIFGVQQQFRSNTRKATIGETRQLAAALEFANLDTGVFPKFNWLVESREGIFFIADQVFGPNFEFLPFSDVEAYGRRPNTVEAQQAFAFRIGDAWQGPYFALSQTRAGLAQGRGGFVHMLLPDLGADNGPNSPSSPGLRWPADPYNNPYVLYMMDIDRASQELVFVDPADATEKGNFVNAVVSYGPNQVPGGGEFFRPGFGAGVGTIGAEGDGPFGLRLYKGAPNVTVNGIITHTYLSNLELYPDNDNRANAWSFEFANNAGIVNQLARSDDNLSAIAITDVGSDDVIFEF